MARAPRLCYDAFAWLRWTVDSRSSNSSGRFTPSFAYPLWSLRADFRMYRYIWLGRMAGEVHRARDCLAAQRR
jgi:hypothetical protein